MWYRAPMHTSHAAGYCALDVDDPDQGVTLPTRILYPTHATPSTLRFGPYTIEAAADAPLAAERPRPVVLVSHGQSSNPWCYRGLGLGLARAGFVVAMPEHIGDCTHDRSLTDTAQNLENRPRHLRRVLDALEADQRFGPFLTGRVGVAGHSGGGYTALALAGGQPRTMPHQTPDGRPQPVPVKRDPRVRALALFAPAVPWLRHPGGLDAVDAPILLRTGEHDAYMPRSVDPDAVARGVSGPVDAAIVPGAGHFSFQSPFPPAFASRPGFLPATDPPGFDRAAYQRAFVPEVVAFFAAHLT